MSSGSLPAARKRSRALIAAGLAIALAATRWPIAPGFLFDWDNVNFALALREFAPAMNRRPSWRFMPPTGTALAGWRGFGRSRRRPGGGAPSADGGKPAATCLAGSWALAAPRPRWTALACAISAAGGPAADRHSRGLEPGGPPPGLRTRVVVDERGGVAMGPFIR